MSEINVPQQEQSTRRLQLTAKAAGVCLFEADLHTRHYTYFENTDDIFGIDAGVVRQQLAVYEKLSQMEYQESADAYFFHADDIDLAEKAFHTASRGKEAACQVRMRAGGCEYKWCELHLLPLQNGFSPDCVLGVVTDIAALKQHTARLIDEERLDLFTGLYNKGYTAQQTKELLHNSVERRHALILLDIDGLGDINAQYGSSAGDRILRALAKALKRSFRKTDILGRGSEDEFFVLAQTIPQDTEWLCEKFRQLTSITVRGISCSVSIGTALFPTDADSYDALYAAAKQALQRSKEQRGTYSFYA